MTQRPHVDQPQLEQMLRESAAATACARCVKGTYRTTRRTAEGRLEVRCVGCGGVLMAGSPTAPSVPGDLPL